MLFPGMLQREHPGIAISVKTRQAIRTILNNARDVIQELKGGGLLDEAEAAKLESVKRHFPLFFFLCQPIITILFIFIYFPHSHVCYRIFKYVKALFYC